jgi:hypothetical protein
LQFVKNHVLKKERNKKKEMQINRKCPLNKKDRKNCFKGDIISIFRPHEVLENCNLYCKKREKEINQNMRINICLDTFYTNKLKRINKIENKGTLLLGTFVKRILVDYIENKIKTDYFVSDGVIAKQTELFNKKKMEVKNKSRKAK